MGAFTSEQWEQLDILRKTIMSYSQGIHEALNLVAARLGALQNLLLTKGVMTEEELEASMKEVEAARMVETSLSPELEALENEFNRLRQLLEEGSTEPKDEPEK